MGLERGVHKPSHTKEKDKQKVYIQQTTVVLEG